MIKQLRDKKVAKWIWIGLCVVILPPFIFWGLGGATRSGKSAPDYAGRVFGRKISFADYRRVYMATRNQYQMQLGEEFPKLEKYLNLTKLSWDRIILLSEAQRIKVRVSDREVMTMVPKYPFFQAEGKFDYATYAKIVEFYFHTTPREFEEQTRDNLTIAKLYDNITAAVSTAPQEVKDAYRKENEQVSIYYISAAIADFAGAVNLNEAQIKEYFTQSPLEFKKPESFNLEYVSVEYPTDAKEENIREIDNKVKKVAARLPKEKDLSAIAEELSLEPKQTAFFTLNEPIPGIGWSPQIIETVSRLKKGEFAPAVQTAKGWYIIRLKEKKESYIPALEEVKDRVKEKLAQLKSREMAKAKIENTLLELRKLFSAGSAAADFDKAAKSSGLKSGATELFKHAGYIPGIGASDKFFDEVEKLDKEAISPVLEGEQGFYIIRLKEKVPIDEEKFKNEETDFSAQLLSRKKEGYFENFLEDLRKKARLEDHVTGLQ